jgi:hypothetical protein
MEVQQTTYMSDISLDHSSNLNAGRIGHSNIHIIKGPTLVLLKCVTLICHTNMLPNGKEVGMIKTENLKNNRNKPKSRQ